MLREYFILFEISFLFEDSFPAIFRSSQRKTAMKYFPAKRLISHKYSFNLFYKYLFCINIFITLNLMRDIK